MKIIRIFCLFLVVLCWKNLNSSDTVPENMVHQASTENETPANVTQSQIGIVDIAKKTKIVEDMTKKAVTFFQGNSQDKACREFGHNNQWRNGEVFPFVLDSIGNVLVHGDDTYLIWQNLPQLKKSFKGVFTELKDTSVKGGWIHYPWYNGFKSAYVKQVNKDGKLRIIGAGFFPESQEYDTQRLVQDAAQLFREKGKDQAVALVNNTYGQFVKGGVYVFIYDFDGNVVGHGDNPALVGQNLINLKDSRGKLLIQEMIKVAKNKEGKGWINYEWKGEPKRAYIEKVVDTKTKKPYLAGAGYHPNTTLDMVYTFVSRAIRHLKDAGAKQAFIDFSNPVGDYIRGELNIFVYDFDGKVMADGDHPEYVGQNLINLRDPEGKYFVKKIIQLANREGKGTVTYLQKNAYKTVYIEKVDTPDGRFIIGSGYFPASKQQNVRTLVEKGVEFLKNSDWITALNAFKNEDGEFFRGDLNLFVYAPDGTALVNGIQSDMIWKNFAKTRDESGKNIIEDLIALAKAGGGWASYKSRNATRRVFVHMVEKSNKQTDGKKEVYIVGSGYYL